MMIVQKKEFRNNRPAGYKKHMQKYKMYTEVINIL